jgi:hypothetical protein
MRFALKMPVEFRQLGSNRWLMGYTEDMGAAAVHFRAGEWVQPKSRIEMIFRMPVADPCDLVCSGVVLRVDLPTQAGLLPTVVATIENYRFVRQGNETTRSTVGCVAEAGNESETALSG